MKSNEITIELKKSLWWQQTTLTMMYRQYRGFNSEELSNNSFDGYFAPSGFETIYAFGEVEKYTYEIK